MLNIFTAYQNINALGEYMIIGGTDTILQFSVVDELGVPISLIGTTITWVLGNYGYSDTIVLTKTGVPQITTGDFTVELLASDTLNLSGKYIQQPIIRDATGNYFRPAQGIITIIPAIKNS